jgi:hypothetical protein
LIDPRRAIPAAVLFTQLAAARRRGEHFEEAWPDALTEALACVGSSSERGEWRDVLAGMVETWRAAFSRWPASSKERALSLLAENGDREPAPDRECEHCHGEIGAERGRLAVFCSDKCRHDAHYAREREGALA